MSTKTLNESILSDIADAIREKKGVSSQYTAAQMAPAILGIESESWVVPLNFTSTENDSTIKFVIPQNADVNLQISYDGTSWSDWQMTSATEFSQLSLGEGDVVYVRGENDSMQGGCFVMTSGELKGGGNVMSLLSYDGTGLSIDEPYCFTDLFIECTSLITPPDLPATTLSEGCYEFMFSGCTSLKTAPALPATVMEQECYRGMFNNCTSLVSAPSLPATTLANYCYDSMFYDCIKLKNAPSELPATTLVEMCYGYMFEHCISLVDPPSIAATTLASMCCFRMFSRCESLVSTPELLAESLEDSCYNSMFESCYSLVYTRPMRFKSMAESSLYSMFTECSSLCYIEVYADSWSTLDADDWVYAVNPTGVFASKGSAVIPNGDSGVPLGWRPSSEVLMFTTTKSGSTISLSTPSSLDISLSVSTDGSTWATWNKDSNGLFSTITLYKGDTLFVRATSTNQTFGTSTSVYSNFRMTGGICSFGNIMCSAGSSQIWYSTKASRKCRAFESASSCSCVI